MARRSAGSPSSPGSPSQTLKRQCSPARAGQILWIPKAEEVNGNLSLEPGQYNHPCILLSDIPKDNGKHVILVITSSGGRPLTDWGLKRKARRKFIPIDPAGPHPDHGMLLHLTGGDVLLKASCANVGKLIEVELKHLHDYPGGKRNLTDESLHQLIKMSSFKPPVPGPQYTAPVLPNSHFVQASADRRLRETIVCTDRSYATPTPHLNEPSATMQPPKRTVLRDVKNCTRRIYSHEELLNIGQKMLNLSNSPIESVTSMQQKLLDIAKPKDRPGKKARRAARKAKLQASSSQQAFFPSLTDVSTAPLVPLQPPHLFNEHAKLYGTMESTPPRQPAVVPEVPASASFSFRLPCSQTGPILPLFHVPQNHTTAEHSPGHGSQERGRGGPRDFVLFIFLACAAALIYFWAKDMR